jgi:hypothetical protein
LAAAPDLTSLRFDLFAKVSTERDRQDKKWGFPQLRSHAEWCAILAEEFGEASMEANEAHFRGAPTVELEKELVQTIAVCVSWLEHMRLGKVRGAEPT